MFVIHVVFTENHLCVCYSRSVYRKSSMCLLFMEYLQKIIYVFVIHVVFTENHLCVCYSRSIYRKSSICVCYSRSIYRKSSMCLLGADHLIFEGGLEDFEKHFLQSKLKEKNNHAAYNREKKYHAKESAQKKIPTCKSTDVLHFSIVSTSLQDFAFFEQAHLLKRTRVNSGQHHRDSTAYNIR